jgi:hypothetical protein
MSISGMAIDRLIVVVNAWTRYVRAHLEIEEGSRVLASLQGHLAGYKDLFGFLSAEFGLMESSLEDNGDIPTPTCAVEDMHTDDFRRLGLEADDMTLEALRMAIKVLREDPRWYLLLNRVEEKTEEMKTYLIDYADKSRDLDLKQGERKGMTIYLRLFKAVEDEVRSREEERERKRKEKEQNSLFEDEIPA